jgi:transposase
MNVLRLNEITETVDELKAMLHHQEKAQLRERIQALYLVKVGVATEVRDLAKALGRSESTIRLWFAHYRENGLLGLLAWNYHGGKRPALSEAVLEALQLRLQEPEGFRSYGEIQDWLSREHDLDIPYKTVHQTVHYKLKAKLKVARPTSRYRQEEAVVDFKKNSRIILK